VKGHLLTPARHLTQARESEARGARNNNKPERLKKEKRKRLTIDGTFDPLLKEDFSSGRTALM